MPLKTTSPLVPISLKRWVAGFQFYRIAHRLHHENCRDGTSEGDTGHRSAPAGGIGVEDSFFTDKRTVSLSFVPKEACDIISRQHGSYAFRTDRQAGLSRISAKLKQWVAGFQFQPIAHRLHPENCRDGANRGKTGTNLL